MEKYFLCPDSCYISTNLQSCRKLLYNNMLPNNPNQEHGGSGRFKKSEPAELRQLLLSCIKPVHVKKCYKLLCQMAFTDNKYQFRAIQEIIKLTNNKDSVDSIKPMFLPLEDSA